MLRIAKPYRTTIRLGAAHADCRMVNTKTGESILVPLDGLHKNPLGHWTYASKDQLGSLAATLCEAHGIRAKKPAKSKRRRKPTDTSMLLEVGLA
jgi:hypothetical protein